jgi:hypothetical protein
MLKSRRSLRAAACAQLAAALLAGTALAQDNGTVGPPQLRDFQLPGTRTTPPAPAPAPEPVQTAPTRDAPVRTAPAASATPAPRRETPARAPAQAPASRRATPAPAAPATATATAPSAQPAMRTPAPTPSPTTPAATPLPPVTAQPQVQPTPQPTPQPQAAPPAEAPAAAPGGGFNWLWLLLLLPVAAALGAFALLRGRRREAERDAQERSSLGASLAAARWIDDEPVTEPVAAAEPVAPVPDAAPAPEPEPEGRAWLELEIKPDRAAATDTEAALHFELTLRNTGPLPARNIRIDSRLFNAADEADVAAFLAGPIHDKSGSPHVSIAPEDSLALGASVALRRDEVREIQIQGRSIFVPALAINVAYDWDGGAVSGRTSRSWVIGRETEGSAKMGPFRLDLGPRVYRQVGGREAQKVMA